MDIRKWIAEMTLEEKASLCSGRDFWHSQNVDRVGIPSAMMCDGPHGLRKQKGEGDHLGINVSIETVCYPTASALAASFDRDLLRDLGATLGEECQAEDVAMLLGPGLNMKRSPLCGRNFEYFSEDPYLAGELGASYIRGLQGKGVAACVKHFAANNQETRRMSGSSNLDERTLHEIYLPAFEAAVKKGKTRSIMCAYNGINGTFCAEDKMLLTDILREKWGYDGFVVTDWGAVKDRVKGIVAGLDLEMPGGLGVQDGDIVKAVQEGRLEEAKLDQTVERILVFLRDYLDARKPETVADRKEMSEKSGAFAAQCAVLLKNEGVLPIDRTKKIAFIGEFADRPRYQGAGSSHINVPHAISALETASGLDVTYAQGFDVHREERNDALLQEALEAAWAADVAVIFAGLPDAYETEGADRDDMGMPQAQNRLIAEVAKVQKNVAVVLHGGAPMELPWADQVGAILCMYLGGERVGEAAVKLLTGEENPCGKLAETWPLRLEDNPSYLNFPGVDGQVDYREGIYIGYRYYDKKKMETLFPFGHGLSYTEFAYSDLRLDKAAIPDTEALTVTCKVKNVGSMAGKEAVQLYVREENPHAARPVRELKGFEKVSLRPGEEKEVRFVLDKRSFAYYEEKIHDWYVESGAYAVEIGASSRDIRLEGSVQVQGTVEIPMTFTYESAVGDLRKTAKGRVFLEQMTAQSSRASIQEDTEAMGEGSSKMDERMMFEMPLRSIVSFGRMTMDQLDGLLAVLNAE
ncbi:MAG: glycosyl hydrolase [Lachnospiraceae bacterium]|nr:glycosyl hydrolase [Lachnospiraceae bacterium]